MGFQTVPESRKWGGGGEKVEVYSLHLNHLFPGDFGVPDCPREQKVGGGGGGGGCFPGTLGFQTVRECRKCVCVGGGGLFPGDFGVPDCPREQKVCVCVCVWGGGGAVSRDFRLQTVPESRKWVGGGGRESWEVKRGGLVEHAS